MAVTLDGDLEPYLLTPKFDFYKDVEKWCEMVRDGARYLRSKRGGEIKCMFCPISVIKGEIALIGMTKDDFISLYLAQID